MVLSGIINGGGEAGVISGINIKFGNEQILSAK